MPQLGREVRAPEIRVRSWAEARAKAVGVDELMQERVWGEREDNG